MSTCGSTKPHAAHGWEVTFGQLGHGGFKDWVSCSGVKAPCRVFVLEEAGSNVYCANCGGYFEDHTPKPGSRLSDAVEASLEYEYERFDACGPGDRTERSIRELRIMVMRRWYAEDAHAEMGELFE